MPPPRPRKRPNPHPITREVSSSLARRLDFDKEGDDGVGKGKKEEEETDAEVSAGSDERLTCVVWSEPDLFRIFYGRPQDTNVLSWSSDSDCKVVEELILRKFDLDLK